MARKKLQITKAASGSELSVTIDSSSDADQAAMLLLFGDLIIDWDGQGMFFGDQGEINDDCDCD